MLLPLDRIACIAVPFASAGGPTSPCGAPAASAAQASASAVRPDQLSEKRLEDAARLCP
jgi:hypothetical protein